MDKVSIIVPVYNVEKYLHRCLDSIVEQTYKNIEVIIIDDGSTDNSGKICDEYDKDLRCHIVHQENKGLSKTRNEALKIISGNYILFVDSDDYIEENLVEKILGLMKKNDADVAIFSNYEITSSGLVKYINLFEKDHIDISDLDTKKIYHLIMMDKILNVVWNKMYKSSIWKGIQFPVGYNYEDLFVQPSLLLNAKKIIYTRDFLYYNNRLNSNSITSNINDFSSRNRYGKFRAYCEHKRIAELIKDEEVVLWATYKAINEAIKAFYIDYNSRNKLTDEEKKEIISYLCEENDLKGKYKLSIKYRLLRWSALYFPIICKLYSKVRFLQECAKNKSWKI